MTEYLTNALLGKLGLLYGMPSKDPIEAQKIISEYARLMTQYSEGELLAAADRLIRNRRFKSWPTIGECIGALEDHRGEVHAKTAPERRTEPSYPEWSREALATADRLCDSEMGRKAAREGWIVGLHDFCRKHRELPSPYQIGAMIEAARFVDRCAAGAEPLGPMKVALQKLANDFLAKREKLARKVL